MARTALNFHRTYNNMPSVNMNGQSDIVVENEESDSSNKQVVIELGSEDSHSSTIKTDDSADPYQELVVRDDSSHGLSKR